MGKFVIGVATEKKDVNCITNPQNKNHAMNVVSRPPLDMVTAIHMLTNIEEGYIIAKRN